MVLDTVFREMTFSRGVFRLADVAHGYGSRTRISLSTYRRNSSVVVKHR